MRVRGPIAESEALVVDTWTEGAEEAPLTYRLISTCAGGYLEVLPGSGGRWMPVAPKHAFHALARRHAVLCVFPETVRRPAVPA